MRSLDSINNSINMNLSKLQEIVEDRGGRHAVTHGATKRQTRLSDWTTKVHLPDGRENREYSYWFTSQALKTQNKMKGKPNQMHDFLPYDRGHKKQTRKNSDNF